MVRVAKLSVQNLRSHKEYTVDLTENTTIFIGRNGAGKTSLIEAVYIALRGGSFKGADIELLQEGQTWWRIKIEFSDGSVRNINFDATKASSKKQFTVNDKKTARLPVKDKIPVILFEPTDLQLLHGSPSRRRKFIDQLIQQVDPTYSKILSRYDRALHQRNTLLKKRLSNPEDLFVWNIALSEYGSQIAARRIRMIELLNEQITEEYKNIAQNNDSISVNYSASQQNTEPQYILDQLEKNQEKDSFLKHTTTGPHRHDIHFIFNNKPALEIASRGEVRSIIIALKYIERNIILKTLGIEPIVLLDDVFSELDENRQEKLTIGQGQHIITTTHVPFKTKKIGIIPLN